MNACFQCGTQVPTDARFCPSCGVPQVVQALSSPNVDPSGNVPEQLSQRFFIELSERLSELGQKNDVARARDRLHETQFFDVLERRFRQLDILKSEVSWSKWLILIDATISELLDFFLIHHFGDQLTLQLPEAILRYPIKRPEDLDAHQMMLDYLALDNEEIAYYLDFLVMPADHFKAARKNYLTASSREVLWVILDGSIRSNFKKGVALTDQAIYWKAPLQPARRVAYQELAELRREDEWLYINDRYFHLKPSIDVKLLYWLRKLRYWQLMEN